MALARWWWARSVGPRHAAITVLVFAASIAVAVSLPAHILLDDAAITLRYAERLASGHGPTYNDHERVQGFSNPLYVLLLAAAGRAGADLEDAARFLGVLALGACVALAFAIARQLGGLGAGLLASATLLVHPVFRSQSLLGMESALGAALGLAALYALLRRRPLLAGLALGLALVNKLDAALLFVAVFVAQTALHRRWPRRLVAGTAIAFLPWIVFAWAYYGQIVPRSALVKLGLHGRGAPPYEWIVELLDAQLWLLGPALAAVLLSKLGRDRRAVATSLLGWLVLHALACSVLDFGDRYPWYTIVLYPLLLTLAAAGTGLRRRGVALRYVVSAISISLLLVVSFDGVASTLHELRFGRPIAASEAFDDDRRLAGIFLDEYSAPDERVQSAYGWVAFESRRAFDDQSLLNSRRMLGSPDYVVHETWEREPRAPPGFVLLATFDLARHLDPHWSSFVVFGRSGSQIAREGLGIHRLRLDRFPAPTEPRGRFERDGLSLCAGAPSSIGYRFDAVPPGRAVFRVEPEVCNRGQAWQSVLEIRVDEEVVFSRRIDCGSRAPVLVPLWNRRGPFTIRLSVVSAVGPGRVCWRHPSLGWGEASIPLDRVRDPALRAAVAQYFPVRWARERQ